MLTPFIPIHTGKRFLLLFVLVQRLLDRLDTAFAICGEIFYFTDNGVSYSSVEYQDIKFRPSTNAWLLSMSDSVFTDPPQQFLVRPRKNFLVHVCGVEDIVQNSRIKDRMTYAEVMNPWTLEEIEFIK